MSWVDQRAEYEAFARSIEPAARLSTKDSWIWTAVWIAAVVLTLGLMAIGMGRKKFIEQFSTTFGPIQAYPRQYPTLSKRLLVHECRHTTQAVFMGWFVPVVGWFFGRRVRAYAGLLPMAVIYLLAPIIPIGLCLGRWLLEVDADRACWRWAMKFDGYDAGMIRVMAQERVEDVCGAAYVWAWPKWLGGRALYLSTAEGVIKAAA
jgi:hypothetical protein